MTVKYIWVLKYLEYIGFIIERIELFFKAI